MIEIDENYAEKIACDPIPLKGGFNSQWTWNRRACSSEVRLYGPGLRIAHFHPSWSSGTAGVRGTKELNNGRHYWELKISHRIFGTSIMFGIGTRHARLDAMMFINLLGEDQHSWGLSHKGLLWHDGEFIDYMKPFKENQATVIGVLFDGIAGTLSYYKDGKSMGVAFRGLDKVRDHLYPIICSTAAKTEVTLCCMRRDYYNLQDRCRAVILSRVHLRQDIDKLILPGHLKKYLKEEILEYNMPIINNRDVLKPIVETNNNFTL